MIKIGAQLYTVREKLTNEAEMSDAIKAIKEIGYDSIQLFLFGSFELIEKCANRAQEYGLEITSILTVLDICEKKKEELFEFCKKYGISDIGISSVFTECQDVEGYIKRVNSFAKTAKEEGFTFSYHNHGHEFIKLERGETSMKFFLEGFDPQTVSFMPNTYWIHDGGYDVRRFLEETQGRVKILHLKDMKRTESGHTFTEVGNGNLYMSGIIKTALEKGIRELVVEQDICEADSVDSLKSSYQTIKKILEA